MESIRKLENVIGGWLKPLPHLPDTWRKWLSENIWWLTLIGVILEVIAIFMLVAAIFAAMAVVSTTDAFLGAYYRASVTTYSGMWYFSSIVSIIFIIATTAITAMAIKPLQGMKKKGWDLLFIVFLLGVASSVVSAALSLTYNAYGLIPNIASAIISAVIGAYFLFEIRSHFNAAKVVKKEK
ncbi:MAG: hypothetical protein WCK26_00220 [Candidatus Saccharibacteria bacterium]